MQTFQIVVWFKDDKGEPKVESLYIGQSGVDAEKAYDDALVAGRKFDRALFISVFAGRPLPLIKADMRGTKPVFANSEPAELPKVNTDSTKELNAKEDTLRHERYEQAAKQDFFYCKCFTILNKSCNLVQNIIIDYFVIALI